MLADNLPEYKLNDLGNYRSPITKCPPRLSIICNPVYDG